jgi:nucleotide-binding universal stress UspA family protein
MRHSSQIDAHAPGSGAPGAGGGFRRILVPADSFGHGDAALAAAARLGAGPATRLRVVHVRTWDPPGRFYFESSADATSVLDRAVTLAWCRGVQASGVVVDARRIATGRAILAEAAAWEADLIVLARRARWQLGVLLQGSVSSPVLRRSPCPVLVVPRARDNRDNRDDTEGRSE